MSGIATFRPLCCPGEAPCAQDWGRWTRREHAMSILAASTLWPSSHCNATFDAFISARADSCCFNCSTSFFTVPLSTTTSSSLPTSTVSRNCSPFGRSSRVVHKCSNIFNGTFSNSHFRFVSAIATSASWIEISTSLTSISRARRSAVVSSMRLVMLSSVALCTLLRAFAISEMRSRFSQQSRPAAITVSAAFSTSSCTPFCHARVCV
mmetsp:Transcript_45801/g.97825  ORF Transcript_45801/g.97825 Transcript_45801/m.97825 type:complete len:208 (-) Transcript_45801:961-1584(-)